jgi:LuxR family transcriptional regulator, maltose regulon positive regulatory protein
MLPVYLSVLRGQSLANSQTDKHSISLTEDTSLSAVDPEPFDYPVLSDKGNKSLMLNKSKLRPLSITEDYLPRPRLIQRIDQLVSEHLSFIIAHAGCGRTTLLSQWYHQAKHKKEPIIWLSLDQWDNQASRFYGHLAAGLHSARRDFSVVMSANWNIETSDPMDLADSILVAILELELALPSLTLIIDDFHYIDDKAIQDSLFYLIENSPPNVHWLLSSRNLSDNTPLSRLTLNQQPLICASELSLSRHEIESLVEKTFNITLTEQLIDKLLSITGGWLAVSKHILITTKNLHERDEQSEISLSDQLENILNRTHLEKTDIWEYISVHVYEGLSCQNQHFLTSLAIVPRVNTDLARAITGNNQADTIIRDILNEGLLLVSRDTQNHWLDFNPMIYTFLKQKTNQLANVNELYLNAAHWYADHEIYDDAIACALTAKHDDLALDILQKIGWSWFYSGRTAELLQWYEQLSKNQLLARTAIQLNYIWCLVYSNRIGDAKRLIEAATGKTGLDDKEVIALFGHEGRLLIEQIKLFLGGSGNYCNDDTLDFSLDGLAKEDRQHYSFVKGDTLLNISLQNLANNNLDQALDLALQGKKLQLIAQSTLGVGLADILISVIRLAKGQLELAKEQIKESTPLQTTSEFTLLWVYKQSILGSIAYEENRLDSTEEIFSRIASGFLQHFPLDSLQTTYSRLAYIQQIKRKPLHAEQCMDQLEAMAQGDKYKGISTSVTCDRIILALMNKDTEKLERISNNFSYLDTHQLDRIISNNAFNDITEKRALASAYLLAHQQEFSKALSIIERLILINSQSGNQANLIQLLSLKSGCLWQAAQAGSAIEVFCQAFQKAVNCGFVRTLIDANPYIEKILEGGGKEKLMSTEGFNAAFFQRVTEATSGGISSKTPANVTEELGLLPLDPLTDREVDILRCASDGKNNQEISEKLDISKNTVKWHMKNIFSKLDSSHRTQAVARARKLSLI